MTQRNAVVIGATRNLGLYVAQQLAARGWSVVGVGRSSPEVAHGVRFAAVDLSLDSAVSDLAAILSETTPELIVSNAVSYGPTTPAELDLATFEDMFRINALVPYLALSRYLEVMPGTTCVVVNSDSVFHANRVVGPYAASKAALKILTTALADTCRTNGGAVSTLLLGPLADDRKMRDCARIAEENGLTVEKVIKMLMKKSNPFYLKESLLQFAECFRSIEYIHGLGAAANGMVCKLDGGSSGSLY